MNNNRLYQAIIKNPKTKPKWGQEFLRDDLIPDLLGDETNSILYWAGKRMARKYPVNQLGKLPGFFQQTDWGQLQLKQRTGKKIVWRLSGTLVTVRLREHLNFTLEAGFLAQSTQNVLGTATEAQTAPLQKQKRTPKWINIIIRPTSGQF